MCLQNHRPDDGSPLIKTPQWLSTAPKASACDQEIQKENRKPLSSFCWYLIYELLLVLSHCQHQGTTVIQAVPKQHRLLSSEGITRVPSFTDFLHLDTNKIGPIPCYMMLLPKLVYLCHLDTFLLAHLNSEAKYSRLAKNYPNEEFQGVWTHLLGISMYLYTFPTNWHQRTLEFTSCILTKQYQCIFTPSQLIDIKEHWNLPAAFWQKPFHNWQLKLKFNSLQIRQHNDFFFFLSIFYCFSIFCRYML